MSVRCWTVRSTACGRATKQCSAGSSWKHPQRSSAGRRRASRQSRRPGRLDGGTIDRLVRRSARLRQLDNYLGGAQTFPLYAAEVRASARLLKQGTYGDAVGRSLLALLAEQAQQAGWAAFDAGIHDQARHLYMESLKAAQQADDAALTGNAYAFLAYQQTALGQNGVEFAEASRDATQHRRVPATVRTLLHERTAWAYATAGDPTNAERALAHAEETIRDVSAEPGPDWAAWVDHAEVQIMTGRVWAVLHKPLRAVPVLKQVLTGFDDAQARDKALYLSWLADSYIDAGEIEQAATITRRCAELSSDVASVRPKLRTAALCKRLEPYRSLPAIAEVLEQTGGTGRPRSARAQQPQPDHCEQIPPDVVDLLVQGGLLVRLRQGAGCLGSKRRPEEEVVILRASIFGASPV
jgi:tetratricopeptide (TPR) repeat protein